MGLCSAAGLGAWLLRDDQTAAPTSTAPSPPLSTSPSAVRPVEPMVVTRLTSAARGREVDLIVMRPRDVPGELPVCLALHGRGASARMFADLGVPSMLTAAVAAGVPPFAVAAVDGDTYWVAANPADDPQRMLDQEVPGWLAAQGLRPEPAAVMGISMGAYGALNYARTHPVAAAAISPALFGSWPDARSRGVFADRAQWEATEPLRHTADLTAAKVGVWCGNADPFAPVARQLIKDLRPAAAVMAPGAHDVDYWIRVLPEVLRFVGSHV
ncbi:S-formylglutathione hydrolase FrmB [Actinokineospora alba]|nr:S-formylglutathione hydrolase FrmB [Actinokineospora alba]